MKEENESCVVVFVKMLFSYGAWPQLGKKSNYLSTILLRSQARGGLVSGKGSA